MFQPTQKNLDDLSHFLGGFRGTFFRDYIVLQKIWLNNKKCGLAEGVKIVHRHDLFFYSSIIAMYPFFRDTLHFHREEWLPKIFYLPHTQAINGLLFLTTLS